MNRQEAKMQREVFELDKRFPLHLVPVSRKPKECGGCTACCTAIGVHELDKPVGVKCQHECEGKGCGIYDSRPSSCQTYYCLWQGGILKKDVGMRPDQLGVIFDWRDTVNGMIIVAWETVEYATERPVVHTLIMEMSRLFCILIRRADNSRTLIGPENQMRKYKDIIKQL